MSLIFIPKKVVAGFTDSWMIASNVTVGCMESNYSISAPFETVGDNGATAAIGGWFLFDNYSNTNQCLVYVTDDRTANVDRIEITISKNNDDVGQQSQLKVFIRDASTNVLSCYTDGTVSAHPENGGAGKLVNGEWYYFAVQMTAGGIKVYLGGGTGASAVAEQTMTFDIGNGTTQYLWFDMQGTGNERRFVTGSRHVNSSYSHQLAGDMNDIVVYDSGTFSATDWNNKYNSGVPKDESAGSYNYYTHGDGDGGTGSTVTDEGEGTDLSTLDLNGTFATSTT